MFKYGYKYAILLDKLGNVEISFFFNLDALYSGGGGGGGKTPLPLDIFTSNTPYIQHFYIALLSYAIACM